MKKIVLSLFLALIIIISAGCSSNNLHGFQFSELKGNGIWIDGTVIAPKSCENDTIAVDLVLKNGSIKVEGFAHIYTEQEPGTVENFSTLFVENDDKVEIKDLENYDIEIKNADCFFK